MSLAALQPWFHAFGWTLTHFIWQGALVGLAFALARTLVPRDHAEARYAIGLAALAALAICPPATLWLLRPSGMVTAATDAESGAGADCPGRRGGNRHGRPDRSFLAGRAVGAGRRAGDGARDRPVADARSHRQPPSLARRRHRGDVRARFRALGGIRRVRILVSRHIDTPTLIGWVNPVILLPAAVVPAFRATSSN